MIAQVNLGDTPPLVHRVSQPLIDERGTWIDADVTYEGLMHMTITTKLNLLRLKRQHGSGGGGGGGGAGGVSTPPTAATPPTATYMAPASSDAIYDSNAESSGASSSESESSPTNIDLDSNTAE